MYAAVAKGFLFIVGGVVYEHSDLGYKRDRETRSASQYEGIQ